MRRAAPATVTRKDLHSKSATGWMGDDDLDHRDIPDSPEQLDEGLKEVMKANEAAVDETESEDRAQEKPPMTVKVKKPHPMDKFVEDLRLMNEMEMDFKKSAIQLQKKLGLETSGFVY